MSLGCVIRAAPVPITAALALILGTGDELAAQVAFGVRAGQADGTASYSTYEANGRVHVWGPVYGSAAFELIGAAWGCTENPIDAVRCNYDGYSLSAGPAIGAYDGDRLFIAVRTALGAFVRTGRSEFTGAGHLTASVGLDGEVRVAGPAHLQVGVTHRRIFDATHDRVVGGFPNYTALSAGISFVFGRGGRAR